MKTTYNVDYFINKFSAIPEELWSRYQFIEQERRCANGHCGVRHISSMAINETDESRALQQLFSILKITDLTENNMAVMDGGYSGNRMPPTYSLKAAVINRGESNEYQQPTPKQRILAALRDIRAMQEKESPDFTIQISYRGIMAVAY